ncbi:hypothetical protein Kpol_1064p23 [Vanderwaltozyma polyspora DSM 70294]|uniref:Translation initiation factor eIF2B subunit gamma n=1 Tax=Vanderwaltozyma polyspora (strain ATCC 22028 / DSM 70294 / BCRC 21397 / CBS 2163 / NBRC 10782 / NRRL Y-8283 / UCD 57-17) TaxID=436907 RepID=A7TME8_VANPO|nr:uncharacterized protein Kpol_1064p23 [Vanderwaltozyma polyspora DSM 70294]EDO16542.1 hypothetical protein Kpol_1064p23 [Vanderwaltozyma polyspora DSM 70294]
MKLQAFIFCGSGGKLSPFVQPQVHHGVSNGLPKALLPVGNRAMLEYVLDWCDQAAFTEIHVVAWHEEIEQIQEGLLPYLNLRSEQFELVAKSLTQSYHSHHLHKPKQINFIASKCNTTGESFQKELLEKITGDFVLLPCDFITDIPPQILIDQFSNRDDDNVAMTVYYKNSMENIDKKQMGKQFFTIYSENSETDKQPVLLDVYAKDDVAKTKYLQIRNHMLWRYPNATVSTKLLNSFIYFCTYDLVKLLSVDDSNDKNNNGDSTNEDETNDVQPIDLTEIKPRYFKKDSKLIKDQINCKRSLAKIFRDLGRRSWQHSEERETLGIFILPDVSSFIRGNNLNSYMESNRYILKIKAQSATKHGQTNASSSAIGVDSVVGQRCTIMEKSNIKMSAIGQGCKIGKRCRIAGSILLPNVEVEDDVILENVIIGPHAKIEKKSKLTNCYVEGYYVVEQRSTLKGETLTKTHIDSEDEVSSNVAYSSSGEEDSEEYSDNYYDDEEFEDDGLFER